MKTITMTWNIRCENEFVFRMSQTITEMIKSKSKNDSIVIRKITSQRKNDEKKRKQSMSELWK